MLVRPLRQTSNPARRETRFGQLASYQPISSSGWCPPAAARRGRPASGRTAARAPPGRRRRRSITVERALRCSLSAASRPRQHRRHARVGAGEDLGPLVAGLAREPFCEDLAHLGIARRCRAGLGTLVGRQTRDRSATPRRTAARSRRRPCTCRRRSRSVR